MERPGSSAPAPGRRAQRGEGDGRQPCCSPSQGGVSAATPEGILFPAVASNPAAKESRPFRGCGNRIGESAPARLRLIVSRARPHLPFQSRMGEAPPGAGRVGSPGDAAELLEEAGLGRFKMEEDAGSGPADLKSRQYKTVIETKGRGLAEPGRPGSGRNESQRDQLERYLDDAAAEDRQSASSGVGDLPWRGCLADGIEWWIYEAIPGGGIRRLRSGRRLRCESSADLWNLLTGIIGSEGRRGLPPPPDDLAARVFDPFVEEMRWLIHESEGRPVYDTKFSVWQQILHGAGIVPPENQPARKTLLFAKHTTLVAAARILKLVLHDRSVSAERAVRAVADGFPAWLPQARGGPDLIAKMTERLKGFDWRGETRDRLKDAYHGLIEVRERKEFGEYYTPDWLARKEADEVLDKEWMDEAITRAAGIVEGAGARTADLAGLGVLDPACGSGTFLFHAARRIQARMTAAHPGLAEHARSILIRLAMGIDTHPIAMEMAKATLEMALPPARPARGRADMEPQVFLGDAMQSVRRGYRDLTERGDQIGIQSPGGRTVPVPLALFLHPDADRLIDRLVNAALGNRGVRFRELDAGASRDAGEARKALTGAISNEANHVWGWYLRNVSGPIRVSESKVGRIVTNPPWLVENDTPEGSRKQVLAGLRGDYGLRARLRGSSAKGDLAAAFTARVRRSVPRRRRPHGACPPRSGAHQSDLGSLEDRPVGPLQRDAVQGLGSGRPGRASIRTCPERDRGGVRAAVGRPASSCAGDRRALEGRLRRPRGHGAAAHREKTLRL